MDEELLNLLADYSRALSILEQHDSGTLQTPKGERARFVLDEVICTKVVNQLKNELASRNQANDLFGSEVGEKFRGVIGNLYQTFNGEELYKTIEEKAAHLLYFAVKDHPFVDGNKRIGAFLFVYFLDKNDFLFKNSGERKINDNALVALTLFTAESNPAEKDVVVKIIMNLITK